MPPNHSLEATGDAGGVDGVVKKQCLIMAHCNNPLNYSEVDPMSMLEGDALEEVSSAMIGWEAQTTTNLFLKYAHSDSNLAWNHEPLWVDALQALNPRALLQAQLDILDTIDKDPDNWTLMEQGDLIGDTTISQ